MKRLLDWYVSKSNYFPAWLSKFLLHVQEGRGFLGKVFLKLAYPLKENSNPQFPSFKTAFSRRLLVAPANYAGQGHLWAKAVEENSKVTFAMNMEVVAENAFNFATDYKVAKNTFMSSKEWQTKNLEFVSNFTHVLVEAEKPIFGANFGGDLHLELEHLLHLGIKTAYISHGTDVRLPSRHEENIPWSPFGSPDIPTKLLEIVARENIEFLEKFDGPVFVSTPDLLLDLPFAHWCPVVVKSELWKTESKALSKVKLVVAHIPSKSSLKGAAQVEELMIELEDEDIIEYRQLSGLKHEDMRKEYQEADIVLDQFLLGSYGVAAVESMAAGRLVVSHVTNQVRSEVKKITGFDLPIVEANLDTLKETLIQITKEPDSYRHYLDLGKKFAQEVHDGKFSAKVIEKYFLDI